MLIPLMAFQHLISHCVQEQDKIKEKFSGIQVVLCWAALREDIGGKFGCFSYVNCLTQDGLRVADRN